MKHRIFTRKNRIRIARRRFKFYKQIVDNSNPITNLNWSEHYDSYLYWGSVLVELKNYKRYEKGQCVLSN